jgi:hypothetical protein
MRLAWDWRASPTRPAASALAGLFFAESSGLQTRDRRCRAARQHLEPIALNPDFQRVVRTVVLEDTMDGIVSKLVRKIGDLRRQAAELRRIAKDHHRGENFLIAAKLREVAADLDAKADALDRGSDTAEKTATDGARPPPQLG